MLDEAAGADAGSANRVWLPYLKGFRPVNVALQGPQTARHLLESVRSA